MSELEKTETVPAPENLEGQGHVVHAAITRRRVLRAGLAVAPVVAALKANSVLAGAHSCVRPSSFASVGAAAWQVSRARVFKDDYECTSHGYWKTKEAGAVTNAYKTNTLFISSTTGFSTNPGGYFTGKSLMEVLNDGGSTSNLNLARHVVAAFLSAVAFGDTEAMLSKAQCQAIWNGQGAWSPYSGVNWTLENTMTYFNKIYGAPFIVRI